MVKKINEKKDVKEEIIDIEASVPIESSEALESFQAVEALEMITEALGTMQKTLSLITDRVGILSDAMVQLLELLEQDGLNK